MKTTIALAACLAIAGCSLLTPGYDETKAELAALAAEAKASREAAQEQAKAAIKAGDPAAIADALDKLSAKMQAQMDAITAQAKHEVDSAAKAGSGLMELLGPSLGAIGIILGGIAQARAKANQTRVDEVEVKAAKVESRAIATDSRVTMNEHLPSRGQPEIDEHWDRIVELEKKIAVMTGNAEQTPQVKVVATPAVPSPAPIA